MSELLDLLRDNTSVLGRLVTTAVLVVIAVLVAGRLAGRPGGLGVAQGDTHQQRCDGGKGFG